MNNLEDNDTLTQRIIGCAIEVHRTLGPGLLESAYEQCMAHEMTLQDIAFRTAGPASKYDRRRPLDSFIPTHEIPQCPLCLCVMCVEHIIKQHPTLPLTYVEDG